MKFQLCSCGGYVITHGHFVDENGPYFRGEGLEHCSENFFCQNDAILFVIKAIKEPCVPNAEVLKVWPELRQLPVQRPKFWSQILR
jgi:hypothetical protein